MPLPVSPDFWTREDVRSALRARDVGRLFRLLTQHTGASQSRIGAAVGLEQGYVSRVIAGRKVTSIEVLERIADGCVMPDGARRDIGLATRDPGNPTAPAPSAGIAQQSWRDDGGHARETVARYLSEDVAPLLVEGNFDAAVGRGLLSATAELTQLAGWQAYDMADHGTAQRYLVRALSLARAAEDQPLGAEVLAAMSHQSSYLGHPTEAVDLARAARQTAQRTAVPALTAEALVLEAHGHARAGDGRACAVALHRAERTLDRADRSADPQWMANFDEAYLSAKFAHCFRALGQAAHTERFARRSLEMDSRYVRGRVFNLALLATSLAQQGDHEQACTVGSQALDLTANLKSARAVGYLRDLRHHLSPYRTRPAVRRFGSRFDAVLGPRH